MNLLSVVIITRNEEENIAGCIASARLVSDDIVVVDSGSSDHTLAIAKQHGARVYSIDWNGYGFSRNYGAGLTKHGWILALDADERISPELVRSIRALKAETGKIYKFRRRNHIGGKEIRFGTLGFETVTRIYHRDHSEWDLTPVHEKLLPLDSTKQLIRGHVNHFGLADYASHRKKARLYAQLSAEKYLVEGRKAGILKKIASPLFNSLKSYFFHLGFLEGKKGLMMAYTIACYSWWKYDYLEQMLAEIGKTEITFSPARQMETVSH